MASWGVTAVSGSVLTTGSCAGAGGAGSGYRDGRVQDAARAVGVVGAGGRRGRIFDDRDHDPEFRAPDVHRGVSLLGGGCGRSGGEFLADQPGHTGFNRQFVNYKHQII